MICLRPGDSKSGEMNGMDRALLKHALKIGLACLAVIVAGMFYVSTTLMLDSSTGVSYVDATGLLLAASIVFVCLMIAAGALTALTLPQYRDQPGAILRASVIAGLTPIVLISITYCSSSCPASSASAPSAGRSTAVRWSPWGTCSRLIYA